VVSVSKFAVAFALIQLTCTAQARMKSIYTADYVLERDSSVIEVFADGRSKATNVRSWLPLNEAGKQELAQSKIYFDSSFTKVKFLSARTRSPSRVGLMVKVGQAPPWVPPIDPDKDRKSYPVNPKSVITAESSVGSHGLRSLKALVVPFNNLELRSSAEYSYVEESASVLPGIYNQTFVYGASFPEISGKTVIRSVKPLLFKTLDPRKHLAVTETREGALYVLTIEILQSAYFVPEDEASVRLDPDLYPRVDVTTAKSWAEVAEPLTKKYETEITKPLPQEFKQIASEASKLSGDSAQINFVVNKLASKITYAGDWQTKNGALFPRGHKKVVESKTGDCKDYATSTVAILRSLGFDAHVALTIRGSGADEFTRNFTQIASVPGSTYFNHAIVHVKFKDGKIHWVDPTNLVVDVETVYEDIQKSPALILGSATQTVEKIPAGEDVNSVNSVTFDIRPDGRTAINGSLTLFRAGAAQLLTVLKQKGAQEGESILRQITTSSFASKSEAQLAYDRKQTDIKEFKIGYAMSTPTDSLSNPEVTQVYVPYPWRVRLLSLASQPRNFDLYIGDVGSSTSRTVIRNMKGAGDVASDCFVFSEWFDLDRKVTFNAEGVVINDTFRQKVSYLPAEILHTEPFQYALGKIFECYSNAAVALATPTKSVNELALSTMTFEKAKGFIDTMGPGYSKRQLTAIRFLESFIEKHPENMEARIYKARAVYRQGFSSGKTFDRGHLLVALADLNFVLSKTPDDPKALLARGNVHFYLKNSPAAAADFNHIRRVAPNDVDSASLGAWLAVERGQLDDAEKWHLFSLRSAKNPKDRSDQMSSLAGFYLDTKQNQKAVDAYKSVLAQDPKSAWTWNNISIAYSALSKFDEAIDAAKKALAISDFGAARANLASGYCGKAKALGSADLRQASFKRDAFESNMNEGLKTHTSHDCLTLAAEYYENRAKTFGELESSKRAFEYYDQLAESYRSYAFYTIAAVQMKLISDILTRGGDAASKIHPSMWPQEVMRRMQARTTSPAAPGNGANTTEASRIPASQAQPKAK
jgi:tetratricopeptide (TPR) repeat protein